ncbi:GNAT family N-acetyltransferase [Bradyrhizobium iriomotense]|uniref:N-acetyltransferase n=1 Tax=Bradyrhizobium iriomotense TaxID=441950 RepID=A0ABQ6AVU9_9BRAD|nr:GNAT family protein [Bradyrhizobium iriomotense]GLR86337.1 N-acetyltransferase [Bradyrhizobium iriomotense]
MAIERDLGRPVPKTNWPLPIRKPHSGRYVDLELLSENHLADLWPFADAAPESFTYLRYGPFTDIEKLRSTLADLSKRPDQPFWVVMPKGRRPQGWLSICDVYNKDGSIEIGSIWFSPTLQGTRAAREAIYLLMCHAMDDLGYERLVWRCQAQNAKSFNAAKNLGFTYEGTWRRAAVVDGWQRDVAWFSMLKDEWPQRKAALDQWLSQENFDDAGQQIERLEMPTG